MRGWIELCSDVNWIDYHGMWARKARDGSWYVIRWTNMVDAMGERDVEECGCGEYEADVKRVDIAAIRHENVDGINGALKSCGFRETDEGIVSDSGDIVAAKDSPHYEAAIVECCIQYGFGAPLESFTGSKYPLRIRAQARKYAEECMRDGDLLEERLERPVNAICTSADNYGKGILFTRDRANPPMSKDGES